MRSVARGLLRVPRAGLSSGAPVRLHYKKVESATGARENLVVLHQFLGSHQNLLPACSAPEINALANSYLLDLANHGHSEHRAGQRLADLAGDLAHFVAQQQLDSFYLLGHSLGGRVVLKFLEQYESLYPKIRGAVIVDSLPMNYKHVPIAVQTVELMKQLYALDLGAFTHRADLEREIAARVGGAKAAQFLLYNLI